MPPWSAILLVFLLAPGLALALLWVGYALVRRLRRNAAPTVLRSMLASGHRALQLLVAAMAVQAALPLVALPGGLGGYASRLSALILLGAAGWAVTAMVTAVLDACMTEKLDEDADWEARRRRTQLIAFRRLAMGAGVTITAGLVLTAIPAARTVGLSMFASAGVAGIIAGLAARPAVSNLIAGIQLALTQPFRLGDAVMIEGEWGHVTEISATFVTITTWDERSLIVPLGYFLERPIRNWTKTSTHLTDTVFLHVDFEQAVEPLRAEARRILEGTALWDRRIFAVQVTDLTTRGKELRVLMSAADADRMFDLRCCMREQLADFITATRPAGWPQERVRAPLPAAAVPPGSALGLPEAAAACLG